MIPSAEILKFFDVIYDNRDNNDEFIDTDTNSLTMFLSSLSSLTFFNNGFKIIVIIIFISVVVVDVDDIESSL